MSLSAAQLASRDGRLTASRVACLMTGDVGKIMNLWRDMVGDPGYVDDDLSGVWPVQLGVATETLNLDWYERKIGCPVTRRGEVVVCPKADWAACTLDGWDASLPAPVEAKHVGGREHLAVVVDRYQPQFHWQMLCTVTQQLRLSVIEAANEPVIETIPLDADYAAELWRRAEAFMRCVRSLTPPVAMVPTAAPVIAERIVDMTGSNEWADFAATWIEHAPSKKIAEAAEKRLKALVPSDAIKCHGYGVQIQRNRAGALSLKEIAA